MKRPVYEGGQITKYIDPNIKKTHFSTLAVVFFIYCITAAGSFGYETVISTSGPGMSLLLLILIPLMWALPMGLYVSELTNLVPADSGPYVWAKMGFGEFGGFLFGMWMAFAWFLTGAPYIVLLTDYLTAYVALPAAAVVVIKIALVIIFTIINMGGLEGLNILDTILAVIIMAGFIVIAIIGFANWQYNPLDPFVAEGQSLFGGLGVGIAIGVWMFCGYTAIANLGGEIDNPQVIPKGMKIAILVITIMYFVPNLAAIVSTGPWYEWGISVDFTTVCAEHIGPWAGFGLMIVAVVGFLAIYNATVATTARSFTVLVQDHLCPKFLGKTTKKGVPIWPMIILCGLNILLVNIDFDVLVIILSPLLFICYSGYAIAMLKIRKTHPVEKRGDLYYVHGKASPYIIVISMCIIAVVGLFMNGTEYFMMGYFLIVAGFIAYPIFKRIYGGCSINEPEMYPLNPKTKLCQGDFQRFGIFFLIFGALALAGGLFLRWYEGDWGPAYYLETYGSGLMSNWNLMITICFVVGIVMLILAAIFWFVGKKIDPIPKYED